VHHQETSVGARASRPPEKRPRWARCHHENTIPVPWIPALSSGTLPCYLDADSITESVNVANVAFGRYDDKFIKDEGRWWFKERIIVVDYSYPLATYREGRGA